MRRLIALWSLVLLGCENPDEGARWLADAAYRREVLEASLTSRDNRYARIRLEAYGAAWESLPEHNPSVVLLDADGVPQGEEQPLDLSLPLLELGRQAFFRYPAQRALRLGPAVSSRAIGLRTGAVEVRVPDGRRLPSLTCAACHAREVDGTVVVGLPNEDLDLGALFEAPWPRGMLDVASGGTETPVAIPDLRAVALQTHLQAAGAVKNGRTALATRIETLLITAHGGRLRPPRRVALALADYLISLAPPPLDDALRSRPGAVVFARRCAGCHAGEGFSGPPVDAELIGGDLAAATSADRGTGGFRVPSLRGVSSRGRLLHDDSIADLRQLLDPGRDTGGHRFARDLNEADRAALLEFLAAL